ncbi:MAG: mannose-1-phosphate guanylyltransferase/mannose-6-phosphate isomerase [Chlamydiales bacterium]|nr:mannose-1-phosphate guanylyltransferase/mannose-6-phosphate isomerase [Chlamydiales bacterium]
MRVIILAGGSGTRLWPISRRAFPKQFLHFGEGESLLQKSVRRFMPTFDIQDMVILTNQEYYHLVKSQVGAIDRRLEKQIIVEPERKNTAPAIALAVKYMQEFMGAQDDDCFVVSSSDHILSPTETFLKGVEIAEEEAEHGRHVVFGIRPNKPETGYGYIKAKQIAHAKPSNVECFVEKPDLQTAQRYLLSGDYLWNSGIFVFRIGTFLRELQKHCPQIGEKCQLSFQEMVAQFSEMPDLSIDYALLEKKTPTSVIPLDISWSDVGSWDSVYEVMDKDEEQNVKIGNVKTIDTKNCLIIGGKRLISTIGLEELLIIETEDAIFIGKKGESQRVKALVDQLKQTHSKETMQHVTSYRPWGSFTILEEGERYKIKRIMVAPQQRLSLQMHYHRSEHWVVVKGAAKVTIGEKEVLAHENESVYVPKSTLHRLENPGKVPLEIIEVQVGEYVGEDDIVRFDDIYGRVPATI